MSFLSKLTAIVRPLVSDQTTGWGLREYLNYKIKPLGMITTLQIDTAGQKGSLEINLKGETQPVRITLNRYELTAEGDKHFLEIKDIQTSREWMTVVAVELAKSGKLKFEVPEMAKTLLKAVA